MINDEKEFLEKSTSINELVDFSFNKYKRHKKKNY